MQLLSPIGLALGLLAVPLVALYFLRVRRARVRVSSVLPWHAVKQAEQLASPFQRFRRNLLLWVQLLLLAALVLAAARPFVWTALPSARSTILVLDTSASMGATDVAPTRFEAARQQAAAALDALGPGDEAMLVTAGAFTEVVTPFTRDGAALRRALAAVQPTDAAGRLDEAVQLALSLAATRDDVAIVVLSDGGSADLAHLPAGPVSYQPIGRSADNAGLVGLELRRSPIAAGSMQLFVTARNSSDRDGRGTVSLALDGRPLDAVTVDLPPGETVGVSFDLPLAAAGVLEVRLDWPGDRLPADDVARAVLEAGRAAEVLLVGGDALLARILASDPRIVARRVAAASVTDADLRGVDAVVLGEPPPPGLALASIPHAALTVWDGGPARFGPAARAPRVLGWNRTHPVTRYTQWDGVIAAEVHATTDPGGLVALVDSDAGPLLLAGEVTRGDAPPTRVAQLSFVPTRSDLPMRVAWPVLVLNTVGWLIEGAGGDASGHAPTGAPYTRRVDGEGAVSVEGPGAPAARVDDGVVVVRGVDRVGVYTVRIGDQRLRFAANLLDAAESAIAPRPELGLPTGDGAGVAAAGLGRRELWRGLLWAALGLAALEGLLYHLRRTA